MKGISTEKEEKPKHVSADDLDDGSEILLMRLALFDSWLIF
jgi:hypothetical protein